MLLNIYSYNGTALNDSNYEAWFPFGQPLGPSARANSSERSLNYPLLSGKQIGDSTLSFHVACKGTIHSQYETLKGLFNINDHTPRALIVTDAADSARQWYVMGTVVQPLAPAGQGTVGEYVVTLALKEPIWRTVTVATATKTITSSGDSKTLTILGNLPARPVITLTVGGGKTGGYDYRQWLPWYNPLTVDNNMPLEITNGGWNTAALIADTSKSNQINVGGGINASVLSFAVDTAVGGGLNTAGGMCYVDTEQIRYTSISAGVMTVAANGRGWGGTTAASHADNAVLKNSQMTADGRDIRVQCDRQEIDYWMTGINTSSTKIWIAPRYQPAVTLSLSSAMGTGAQTTLSFAKLATNLTMLQKLPSTFVFIIQNECFYGSNVDLVNYKFTVTARAQRGTSAASHAQGQTIRFIEHDLFLMWGSADAEAQTMNDTYKPIINLSTSTNTSWVWESFATDAGLRTAEWRPTIIRADGALSSTPTHVYTATQDGDADPATVIGIAAKAYSLSGTIKAENFDVRWGVYHPAGFTTVTASGYKRRLNTGWGVFALYKSLNGTTLTAVFTEATPASPSSWAALAAHSSVSLSGSYPYLILKGSGSVAAAVGNENDLEFTDFTGVISSGNVIQLAFTPTAESGYSLNTTISVTETGDSFTLTGTLKIGTILVIDTDKNTIKKDGVSGGVVMTWNTIRLGWLDLPSPAQYATCTLVYTETGVSNMVMDVAWEHRSIL